MKIDGVGTLQTDEAFFTGKNGQTMVNELPFPVDAAVLDRHGCRR